MKQLLELAERCERERPDPYLASAILVAIGHQTLFRSEKFGWEWRKDGNGIWSSMPRPDLSLDAAVTLVPEGHGWLARELPRAMATASVWLDWLGNGSNSSARTAALALCAAALKARAALAEQDDESKKRYEVRQEESR